MQNSPESDNLNNDKIDVLINVFGKPYQTALSLLTLMKYSGTHIDKIYFHQEPCTSEFERKDSSALLEYLGDRAIKHVSPEWCSNYMVDEQRLANDESYRLSLRYQYGWEQTRKKYVLIIHNDIEVTGDIAGELLENIGEATAIGELGQCWWCPAEQNGLCSSESYTEYKPGYEELMSLYNENMDYTKRRAYNLGLRKEYQEEAWPLPECRINEWCMLVNLEKARPDTQPYGKAPPLGAIFASGAKIGRNWDEDVELDTGVMWFRLLSQMGHSFRDYPIEKYIVHDRKGNRALMSPELYVNNEITAKAKLRVLFPEFASTMP